MILILQAESFEQVARWVKAIETGEPIIIEDIEDIRESAPEEYDLYKRLRTQSILAVPYRNCNSGFLVVRNPKRFKDFYEALNVMAYIVTNEVRHLDFGTVKTYITQYLNNSTSVRHATMYHIKSLYRQCLTQSSQYMSGGRSFWARESQDE